MVPRKFLGELEQLVLITVVRLGDDAYGMRIRREIEARTGRDVAIGAVYSALDRMERKGFVTSEVGKPAPTPGGRARRVFGIENEGRDALEASLHNLSSLLDGLDLGLGSR